LSIKVREWLKLLKLFDQTTHEDRVRIDREIERRKGVSCDEAIQRKFVTEKEFREIVDKIFKKKRKEAIEMVI
jgi:hypothetical protein